LPQGVVTAEVQITLARQPLGEPSQVCVFHLRSTRRPQQFAFAEGRPSVSVFATRFVIRSVTLHPIVPSCDRLFTFAPCVKRARRRNIFAPMFPSCAELECS
jgi:hypothetical protein